MISHDGVDKVGQLLLSSGCKQLEEITRAPSYYVDEDYPARPEIQ